MGKKVVWTHKAKNERFAIFEFWLERTGSNRYPRKLRRAFKHTTEQLKTNPFLEGSVGIRILDS